MKLKNTLLSLIFFTLLVTTITVNGAETINNRFSDVPSGHWSETVVHRLRDLGITTGVSEGVFGLGRTISRAEFVTFLVRLKEWPITIPETSSFTDVSPSDWFYTYVETAKAGGALKTTSATFRPKDNITREEMAVMIINTLGYDTLAELMNDEPTAFSDVTNNKGYIALLNSFGIVNGKGNGTFEPSQTAKREEAAAILIRMYDKINGAINTHHVFYADSSYSQMNAIKQFDSVGFGWAGLNYNETTQTVSLNSKRPQGYTEPKSYAIENKVATNLSILASDATKVSGAEVGIVSFLLEDETSRNQLITDIIATITGNEPYDGVIIDFEEMVSADLKQPFNTFLQELDEALTPHNKTLTVMVQPSTYYKGYDFRAIGEIADTVIMMAHDFNTKRLTTSEQNAGYAFTPVAPIQQVYEALAELTDPVTGVADRSKVALQVSMGTAQWGINADKSVYNQTPYQPTYDMVYNRLLQDGTTITYNENAQSPKATYYNTSDNLDYVIWYEDSRSVAAKIQLAKMFGIQQLSLWRLGNTPDHEDAGLYMDVLDTYLNE